LSNAPEFLAHVLDLARAVGPADARRMFGGHGIYVDGLIVGLVVDDTLYLKTDGETRPAFEARGLAPFRFTSKRKGAVSTSYYTPPEEALENRAAMREWLTLALAAGRRATSAKSKRTSANSGQARR